MTGLHLRCVVTARLLGLAGALLLSACAAATTPPATPVPLPEPTATPAPLPEPTATPLAAQPEWELVWNDEFDGDNVDPSRWVFDQGGSGWGNNELQFYTDRPENARVADGMLVIEARREDRLGRDFTSARLKTQSLHAWTYGRVEARMKLPTGQGIWSAFWMLGEDIVTAKWPASGEIDIMENIGAPRTVYATVHGPGYSGANGIGASYNLPEGSAADGFHVYAVEWGPDQIRWFVDDVQFASVTPDDLPSGREWVFDHPFFLLLNVAVGGNWPGNPDDTTTFPQTMLVDYVRVYQEP
jgi:beta-glucanase (GH16 family)